jgi:MFS family permease
VFGILNTLVSVASFLPIIIVGPVSDTLGTAPVLLAAACLVGLSGVGSIVLRARHTAIAGPDDTASAGSDTSSPDEP